MAAQTTTASTSEAPNPALTTPYVFPPECAHTYNLTTRTKFEGYRFVSEQLLYVQTYRDRIAVGVERDAHWRTCKPAVKASVPSTAAIYSGAVCPSAWIAWDVGLTSEYVFGEGTTSTWSTAFCCQAGHTLAHDDWKFYGGNGYGDKACMETFRTTGASVVLTADMYSSMPWLTVPQTVVRTDVYDNDDSDSYTKTTSYEYTKTVLQESWVRATVTYREGRGFYPPWTMEWVESDNPTLSPTWPPLTNDMLIPSWVPGSAIKAGEFDNKGEGPLPPAPAVFERKWALPVMIVLGVLLLLALAGMGLLTWRVKKLKRELSGGEMKEGIELAENDATSSRERTMRDHESDAEQLSIETGYPENWQDHENAGQRPISTPAATHSIPLGLGRM